MAAIGVIANGGSLMSYFIWPLHVLDKKNAPRARPDKVLWRPTVCITALVQNTRIGIDN